MIISSLGQGLLWAPLAIGVFITFRILDIPDLTTEGSFPFGAAVAVSLMLKGQSAITASLVGFLAGCLAGLITGLLDTKLHIPSLLAGILTMTGLYSINMHIMGKSNVPLLNEKVLTEYLPSWDLDIQTIVLGLIVTGLVVVLLYLMFKTRLGLSLMATGNNKEMSSANGINTDGMIIFGYMISNGLIALSGALIAQSNGYADIGMGIGTIVIGLASVLVGEIFLRGHNILTRLIAMVVGAIVYRLLLTVAMSLGFPADDLKILSAIILVIVICVPIIQNKIQTKRQLKKYLQQMEAKDDESTTSAAPTKSLLSRD
ncbi:ABC transporter permease [Companilactobacillus pabuli]|jgi:putative ABC transport system permease protein|uniref:ABC transporter permease n=1 Tax=Companilactobacillus pabuli TaxID=2714036 RepID=A0A7L7KV82_9LACO|nr:ABC transporter permease [Companilactobacillus pabuli]AKP03133.1 ABC transporter permease [Companilactobacillus farciminis]AKS51433.1 ABC transporter permease [Companilactobacillus farciminis]MDG5112222.1 ABC transporter permease [Companilactobacillus pabuli]QMT83196.1 ABC transporter permease [Companilactobacillus pabuli]GAQ01848.1 ABC transporter permease [Companilactobacillus farciminis]